jgi:hypothetical protein
MIRNKKNGSAPKMLSLANVFHFKCENFAALPNQVITSKEL